MYTQTLPLEILYLVIFKKYKKKTKTQSFLTGASSWCSCALTSKKITVTILLYKVG